MSNEPKDGGPQDTESQGQTAGKAHTGGKSARRSSKAGKNTGPNPRSAARTGAVQALYQMDLAGSDVATVIHEFTTLRFTDAVPEAGQPDPDEAMAVAAEAVKSADPVFFSELLRGVVRRQRDIDPMIEQQLATGWRLLRIEFHFAGGLARRHLRIDRTPGRAGARHHQRIRQRRACLLQ